MRKKHAVSIFGASLAIIGVAAMFSTGMYPIAFVGVWPISKWRVEAEYDAAFRYYITAIKTYGGNIVRLVDANGEREMRRAALNHTINAALIRRELKRRLGRGWKRAVEERLSAMRSDDAFKESAATLYGIEFKTYENLFLVPQAAEEILESRLMEEERSIDKWLSDSRASARVSILYSGITWRNGDVVYEQDEQE